MVLVSSTTVHLLLPKASKHYRNNTILQLTLCKYVLLFYKENSVIFDLLFQILNLSVPSQKNT